MNEVLNVLSSCNLSVSFRNNNVGVCHSFLRKENHIKNIKHILHDFGIFFASYYDIYGIKTFNKQGNKFIRKTQRR